MSITQQQKNDAIQRQNIAAHDLNPQVRLIAGPGTGKSFAIQERVFYLFKLGIPTSDIFVVSFTRASSRDLRDRIYKYCEENGYLNAHINVSTLHSLALRALRYARQLNYPVTPSILDDWEAENIIDNELSTESKQFPGIIKRITPGRCKDVRLDYEAYCGTGQWNPPNYIPPDPPISQNERSLYQSFHLSRTQIYSCILPGEIIRLCLEKMQAGVFDPKNLLGMSHLIVDEYQDLNPIDIQFIDMLIQQGVNVFVAGDDDQSIYSFRFASPTGIQLFKQRFPQANSHVIKDCFRCTPEILDTANTLIMNFADPNRLPKQTVSLYVNAQPPERGICHRWIFPGGKSEARAIAESCKLLIQQGLPPDEIMILISNSRVQLRSLLNELIALDINFESPRSESFTDSRIGRFILGIFRVIFNNDDYLAHRLILGQLPNVGPGICNKIAELCSLNILNYKDIFYNPLPNGVFAGNYLRVLNSARDICRIIYGWLATDLIAQRTMDINDIILRNFGQQNLDDWLEVSAVFPKDMTLEEIRDYLWADNLDQAYGIIQDVYDRLGQNPVQVVHNQKIKVMTFHGAKGLSSKVVFIPGLEEEILPGQKRIPYNGLVLEAARMLYVAISRARGCCILSYTKYRGIYGVNQRHTPSRFNTHLSGSLAK